MPPALAHLWLTKGGIICILLMGKLSHLAVTSLAQGSQQAGSKSVSVRAEWVLVWVSVCWLYKVCWSFTVCMCVVVLCGVNGCVRVLGVNVCWIYVEVSGVCCIWVCVVCDLCAWLCCDFVFVCVCCMCM